MIALGAKKVDHHYSNCECRIRHEIARSRMGTKKGLSFPKALFLLIRWNWQALLALLEKLRDSVGEEREHSEVDGLFYGLVSEDQRIAWLNERSFSRVLSCFG